MAKRRWPLMKMIYTRNREYTLRQAFSVIGHPQIFIITFNSTARVCAHKTILTRQGKTMLTFAGLVLLFQPGEVHALRPISPINCCVGIKVT